MQINNNIRLGPTDIFWGEISPTEHLVQIYEDTTVFLDALEGFVAGGLRAGDGVVIIATPEHRSALAERLGAQGLPVAPAAIRGQYIALDAEETLARFMDGDWPDEDRFNAVVTELLSRGRKGGRRVRAFGEMVAILWARGSCGATVRLEHLWHGMCHSKGFSLFCAYPKVGFTQNMKSSIDEICAAHSRVIGG